MAAEIKVREYEEIVKELFAGNESALAKLAKVWRTHYEMNLWRVHGLPLQEIEPKYKKYFSERFLKGERCDRASQELLDEGFKRLGYAVGIGDTPGNYTGCYARCMRLVMELNEALKRDNLRQVEPEKFINWLTFDYDVPTGWGGEAMEEKPYSFVIQVFHSDENRHKFWCELQRVMREKRRMSMQGVLTILRTKERESIVLTKGES